MEKNTMDHMEELKQQFAILTDKLESQVKLSRIREQLKNMHE